MGERVGKWLVEHIGRGLLELWCRITIGHLFAKYGEEQGRDGATRELLMCKNCLKIVSVYKIS